MSKDTSFKVSNSSSIPEPFLAAVKITGIPRESSKSFLSIVMPFFLASSIKLIHKITLSVSSITWNTKFKFLSRHVASHTTITASGLPKHIKSRATISSCDKANKEYVPGKSINAYSVFLYLKLPRAVATVFPGQFPVCCLSPVRWLNTVLLPVFGLPANAITNWSSLLSISNMSFKELILVELCVNPILISSC